MSGSPYIEQFDDKMPYTDQYKHPLPEVEYDINDSNFEEIEEEYPEDNSNQLFRKTEIFFSGNFSSKDLDSSTPHILEMFIAHCPDLRKDDTIIRGVHVKSVSNRSPHTLSLAPYKCNSRINSSSSTFHVIGNTPAKDISFDLLGDSKSKFRYEFSKFENEKSLLKSEAGVFKVPKKDEEGNILKDKKGVNEVLYEIHSESPLYALLNDVDSVAKLPAIVEKVYIDELCKVAMRLKDEEPVTVTKKDFSLRCEAVHKNNRNFSSDSDSNSKINEVMTQSTRKLNIRNKTSMKTKESSNSSNWISKEFSGKNVSHRMKDHHPRSIEIIADVYYSSA